LALQLHYHYNFRSEPEPGSAEREAFALPSPRKRARVETDPNTLNLDSSLDQDQEVSPSPESEEKELSEIEFEEAGHSPEPEVELEEDEEAEEEGERNPNVISPKGPSELSEQERNVFELILEQLNSEGFRISISSCSCSWFLLHVACLLACLLARLLLFNAFLFSSLNLNMGDHLIQGFTFMIRVRIPGHPKNLNSSPLVSLWFCFGCSVYTSSPFL